VAAHCNNRENAASEKPEVHKILQRRQRRTGPRPRATRTEKLVKYGHVALKSAGGEADRQTHRITHRPTATERHSDYNTPLASLPGVEYSKTAKNRFHLRL